MTNLGDGNPQPGVAPPGQLAQETLATVQHNETSGKPFFLVYAPTVPHVEPSLPIGDDPNWPSAKMPENRLDFNIYTDTWRLPLRGRLKS